MQASLIIDVNKEVGHGSSAFHRCPHDWAQYTGHRPDADGNGEVENGSRGCAFIPVAMWLYVLAIGHSLEFAENLTLVGNNLCNGLSSSVGIRPRSGLAGPPETDHTTVAYEARILQGAGEERTDSGR